ncbi:MAG: hypothetical protein V8Q75_02770 [Bacilli bacterium]
MNKKETVSSIILKMTDDNRKNTRILKSKLIFLNNTLSLKDFVSEIHNEDGTYNAIKAYLYLCNESKCNDLIMEQDDKGNNFLHIAINNGFSINFINRCICLVKYVLEPYQLITPFINQVNYQYQTLMHKILYKYFFNVTDVNNSSISNTISLFKILVDLGFNYKLDDINGEDILSLIEALHNKAKLRADKAEVPLSHNMPYQSVKKLVTETEKYIFFYEYTPIFKRLTDFTVFENVPFDKYKYNINQNIFFTVFKHDSFRLLKSIENCLNDNTVTISKGGVNDNAIIYVIKTAIESGFNVNCKPTIMRHVLDSDVFFSFKEIYRIYSLLCNHGYITYDADFTEDDLIKCIGSVKNEDSSEYMDKLKQLYRQQRFISLLTLVLGNRGLKVDDNFVSKYNNCYIEFNNLWSELQNALRVVDDEYFVNMVIDGILEKRQKCLNDVDNGITIDEMISSLVSLFENLNNSIKSTIDNVKIKILDI